MQGKRASGGYEHVQPSKLQKLEDANVIQRRDKGDSIAGKHQTAVSRAAAVTGSCIMQPPRLQYAVSCDKGTRTAMEDVHVCIEPDSDSNDNSCRVWHFALYDGHGGVQCAAFASQQLHSAVLQSGLLTTKAATTFAMDVKAAKQAVAKGFTATDELLLKECAKNNWSDGATCVAVWLVGSTALVANIGDAKCVLARRPQQDANSSIKQTCQGPPASGEAGSTSSSGTTASPARAVVVTKDHLAMFPEERMRIEKAGGQVTADGRLDGRIQVSRSFGDAQFKARGCSAIPAVTAFSIGPRESFLLLGCDGFWSVMDPQGAVDLVTSQLQQGRGAKAATNRLLHEAVTERRCKDNCTVMLVVLEQLCSSNETT